MKNINYPVVLTFWAFYISCTHSNLQFINLEGIMLAGAQIEKDWQSKPAHAIRIVKHLITAPFLDEFFFFGGRGNVFLPMVGKLSIIN